MLIDWDKKFQIHQVALHRKSPLGYKSMSDYRGILDYKGVRLEGFQTP